MPNEVSEKGVNRYLCLLILIIFISILGVGALSVGALVNHMDILTFIASFNTKQITVAELQQGKVKSVVLIDVRSPEEYVEDHIGQSLFVPLTYIEAGVGVKRIRDIAQASTQSNHTQPTIVLYCTSGMRSVKAYQKLEKTGLNLVVLKGSITAWRKAIPAQKEAEILSRIDIMYLTHSSVRE
ncbi:hypothetical protein H6F96_23205 [Microcoleus sp. FACHB-53]|nr:hypothetical protein [Microcoleus sp. FACHB-53]